MLPVGAPMDIQVAYADLLHKSNLISGHFCPLISLTVKTLKKLDTKDSNIGVTLYSQMRGDSELIPL